MGSGRPPMELPPSGRVEATEAATGTLPSSASPPRAEDPGGAGDTAVSSGSFQFTEGGCLRRELVGGGCPASSAPQRSRQIWGSQDVRTHLRLLTKRGGNLQFRTRVSPTSGQRPEGCLRATTPPGAWRTAPGQRGPPLPDTPRSEPQRSPGILHAHHPPESQGFPRERLPPAGGLLGHVHS